MSGTRQPFYDLVPTDTYHLIPSHTQMIVVEGVTIEAGATLEIETDARLVVLS